MAYMNNRTAARPRATFQEAGGMSILYRHPALSGQISGASPIDEVDVTKSLRLNDTFLRATPLQDSASVTQMVDGSTLTITNHSSAGKLTLTALETTGFVGTGDFIAALHLVKSSKDAEGGTITVIRRFNGKKRIRVYYGVGIASVPDEVLAGNEAAPYEVTLTYGGWFEGAGGTELSIKTIWAVGNKYGLKGVFKPYAVQYAEGTENGGPAKAYFDGGPAGSAIGGEGGGVAADTDDVVDGIVSADNKTTDYTAVIPDDTNPRPTWEDFGVEQEGSDETSPAEAAVDG